MAAAPIPVTFRDGDVALSGSLYLPPGRGPYPAVVALHPAGGATREFPAFGHLTSALPAAGFGVLLFDRRGSGQSTGDFQTASFDDLARDGIAAISYLRKRRDIDPQRIGIWGMSQGAWLAILAAARSSDIGFVVSVSGPGVSPAKQMDYAATYALRASGQPQAVVDRALAAREAVNAYFRGSTSREDAQRAIAGIRDEPWFDQVFIARDLPEDPRRSKWHLEMDYDPMVALARVRVPIAFFFGDIDPWVPVDQSIANIKEATRQDPHVAIQRIAAANHYMATGGGDATTPTSAVYVERLVKWLSETAGRSGKPVR
jgi:pimeloyl-ACP methyl ester carboxylesterase